MLWVLLRVVVVFEVLHCAFAKVCVLWPLCQAVDVDLGSHVVLSATELGQLDQKLTLPLLHLLISFYVRVQSLLINGRWLEVLQLLRHRIDHFLLELVGRSSQGQRLLAD